MRVPLILLKRCLAKAFVLLAVAAMLTGAPRPAAAEDWPTETAAAMAGSLLSVYAFAE